MYHIGSTTTDTFMDITNYFVDSRKCPHRINSDTWLTKPRFGNIHDELKDDTTIRQMFHFLLPKYSRNDVVRANAATMSEETSLTTVFGQSLCHAQSQFRNISTLSSSSAMLDPNEVDISSFQLRQMAVKLIYLALHYHQHQFAIPEAEQRFASTTTTTESCTSQTYLTKRYNVGRYDYECPNAKYLIVGLGGNGLGANVRGGMVPAMMLGLMTNRVVLFMNNLQTNDTNTTESITDDWALASCPRKDYQCFFWPISPCVVTIDDIVSNSYTLSYAESRRLIKRQEQPKNAEHYKVWIWRTVFQPIPNFHTSSAERLYQVVQHMIETTSVLSQHDPELVHRALEYIRTDDGDRETYNFAAATSKVQHTITIYVLRPHPMVAQKLDTIIADIVPTHFNPEYSIGLPVRGTRVLCCTLFS
jgi:hypothetical protein